MFKSIRKRIFVNESEPFEKTPKAPSTPTSTAVTATSVNSTPTPVMIHNYCFMLAGSMVGLWVSYAAREQFSFEELFLPSSDLPGSVHRVMLVSLSTAILALFGYFGVTSITLAQFSRRLELQSNALAAVLFGAFAGLGERFLGETIFAKAQGFLKGMGIREN